MTTPFMPGSWNTQKNGYVPSVLNVNVNVRMEVLRVALNRDPALGSLESFPFVTVCEPVDHFHLMASPT